jgi:hypothetical protein
MYYILKKCWKIFKIVMDLWLVIRVLLPFLKTGTTTPCFHRGGDFPCNKLTFKI